METRKVTRIGVLVALAMVFSYVESLIPAFVPLPGVKIGLANVVVVFALYTLGFKEALGISITRVVLSALLFGSALSMVYSLAGAIFSLLMMVLFKRFFGTIAVSVIGAVSHNLAQVATACLILRSSVVAYYLPVLILTAVVSGTILGLVAAIVIERLEDGDSEVEAKEGLENVVETHSEGGDSEVEAKEGLEDVVETHSEEGGCR